MVNKTIISIITFFVCTVSPIAAQHISEDNGGTSSILLPVGNLSINTADSKIKLGYMTGTPSSAAFIKNIDTAGFANDNKYLTAFDSVTLKNRFIIGTYISGKNSEGTAALLNEGKFTPGSGAELILGFKFYPHGDNYFRRFREIEDYSDAVSHYRDSTKSDVAVFNEDLLLMKNNLLNLETQFRTGKIQSSPADTQMVDSLLKQVKFVDENSNIFNSESLLQNLQKFVESKNKPELGLKPETYGVMRMMLVLINVEMNGAVKSLASRNSTILGYHNRILDHIDTIKQDRVDYATFYIRGAFDRRKFTLYQPGQTNLGQKYLDTTFGGYSLTANLNYLMPEDHIIFGFGLGYERFDSYSGLTSRTIETSKVVYSDSTRTDKLNKTLTVYEGDYKIGYQIPLLFDACLMVPAKKSELVVMYGMYYRYNKITTKNTAVLYDNWNAGISINLLQKVKSKFIIGAFLQTGNYKEGKQREVHFEKTLSAGLTLKLNLMTFSYDRTFTN